MTKMRRVDPDALRAGDIVDWDDFPQKMRLVRVIGINKTDGIARVTTIERRPGSSRPLIDTWIDIHRLLVPVEEEGQ